MPRNTRIGAVYHPSGGWDMPVDQTIRQLAADPDAIFTIRAIDCFFEFIAKGKDLDRVFAAELTTEQMVEELWKMMKRGLLRLMDDGDDDDAPLIQETVTPAERAHARVIGAKLFAVRQRLRRSATMTADVKDVARASHYRARHRRCESLLPHRCHSPRG